MRDTWHLVLLTLAAMLGTGHWIYYARENVKLTVSLEHSRTREHVAKLQASAALRRVEHCLDLLEIATRGERPAPAAQELPGPPAAEWESRLFVEAAEPCAPACLESSLPQEACVRCCYQDKQGDYRAWPPREGVEGAARQHRSGNRVGKVAASAGRAPAGPGATERAE